MGRSFHARTADGSGMIRRSASRSVCAMFGSLMDAIMAMSLPSVESIKVEQVRAFRWMYPFAPRWMMRALSKSAKSPRARLKRHPPPSARNNPLNSSNNSRRISYSSRLAVVPNRDLWIRHALDMPPFYLSMATNPILNLRVAAKLS